MAEKELFDYTEDSIKSLDWKEHIRLRPGMYIGKLGDGSSPDDGIYVLLKEVIDNCIDEHTMGYGKHVDVNIEGKTITVRDYGRGIPLGKVVDVVSKINTGAKYDSKAFQKSVGLNGVGTKAVNALSQYFKVTAYREGKEKTAEFEKGTLTKEHKEFATKEDNGTFVTFVPDETVFKTIEAFTLTLGKTTAISEDYPAFIVNRILLPMINEAIYTLYEGVGSVTAIDTAMKLGAHHPMGPLELADFIGLDTCLSVMQVLHDGLADSKYRPCPLLVKYVEAGWLGRKVKRGFYDYRGETPVPTR